MSISETGYTGGDKMKNILKLEITKAVKNKFFLFSITFGCLLGIVTQIDESITYFRDMEYVKKGKYLSSAGYSVFNSWIGAPDFSVAVSVFFFVLPLLAAIPYGWSCCEERNSGYRRSIIVHTGKNQYYLSKYIATFISGGLAIAIPMVFSFFLAHLFLPVVMPLPENMELYAVWAESFMSWFYYNTPYLYVLLYIIIDFIFAGLLACITMAVTTVVRQKWIVVIIPLFFCLIVDFLSKFVTCRKYNMIIEISPICFLHPAGVKGLVLFSVISFMALAIFIVTFLIGVVIERKRDIY